MKRCVNQFILWSIFISGIIVILTIDDLVTVAQWYLLATAFVGWVFVILYAIRSPWRRTHAGKSIMYSKIIISVLCTWFGLAFVFRFQYAGKDELRAFMTLAIFLTTTNIALTLFRIQQMVRHPKKFGLKDPDQAIMQKN